jgi:TolB protein
MSVYVRRRTTWIVSLAACGLVFGLAAATSTAASSSSSSSAAASQRGTFPGKNGILTFARIGTGGAIDIIGQRPNGTHRRVFIRSPKGTVSVFTDWSPDGRTLAFDRRLANGNIEVFLRRPGGEIVRLTHSPGSDSHPTWTPNGKRIAFESNRSGTKQIWMMRRDGSHVRQVTHRPSAAEEPAYSPSGKWIVFLSGEARKTALFVVHPDGSGVRKVTARPLNAGHPSWSPNGRWIIFNSHIEKPDGRIYVVSPNGKRLRKLTHAPKGSGVEDFDAVFSPNGRWIAFTSFGRAKHEPQGDADIWVRRVNGAHLHNVTGSNPGFEVGVSWRTLRHR